MVQNLINHHNTSIRYDDPADVLYISFGDPRPGIAVEVGDGDLVRLDQYTNEIVGITIIAFKQRYMPSPSVSLDESARTVIPQILGHFNP